MNNFIVNDSSEIREHFNILKRIKTATDYKQTVNPETKPEIPQLNLSESKLELEKHFQKMKLKGFSDSTIRSYQSNLTQFFSFFEGSALDSLTKEQIKNPLKLTNGFYFF